MNPKKLSFKNRKNIELAAHLYLPLDQHPKFFAIFAHCFTCSQNFSAVKRISTSLSQKGIAVLSFDFTGLGRSQGEFEDSDFSSNISDLSDAYEFLKSEYETPKMLVGHSLGGAAVLYASFELAEIQSVVTIAAPAFPGHVKKLFKEESISEIEKKGSAEVVIGGRPFQVSKEFLDDLNQKPLENTLKNIKKSLLFIHSPQDEIVDITNAAELYQAARHPKSFISLDGSDHMLSKAEDSKYVGEVIASWSKRYITLVGENQLNDTEGNQVKVRLSGPKYTTEIKTPHHHLIADEPLDVGGENLGPNPYDFLMASLGSCTAMTLRMYADRKKWPLKEVSVFLNHDKVHLKDSINPTNKKSKVSRFTRLIELEGDLDEDQRHRLLEISHRCPVHRTLEEEIVIQTLLKK